MNHIKAFLHCRKCLDEMPVYASPREYARFEVGWTEEGLQIWCTRHECNVLDLDFKGQQVTPLPDDYWPGIH